jgi:hypothetical protein
MTMHTKWLGALSALGVLINACSSSAPSPAPAPSVVEDPSAAAPPPARETASVTETEPEPSVVLETDADFDGMPGDEHLLLRADGTLEVGPRRGHADVWEISDHWMGEQARLSVVMLDRRGPTPAVLVTLPIAEDEDPPNRYQLFVADDASPEALRRVLDITLGAYGVRELVFSGDGTARYDEDGWTACERLGHPTRANRQRVTLRMVDGEMIEHSRRDTRDVQICDQLAACPLVYVVSDGGLELRGEILRDLRGQSAYAAQTLAVGSDDDGELVVRLAEEKPEVTYLDEIYLEVDGIRIPPRTCTVPSPRPDYCLADGVPFVMREGESLELTFDASGPDALLHAAGYYVPTAPR